MNLCTNPHCEKQVAVGPGRTGKFCSRSCANSYNNIRKPKRQLSNVCKGCPKKIPSNRFYCDNCSPKKRDRGSITIGELRAKSIRHAQVYNALRQESKALSKSLPQLCVICGYSNHVEVAHLRPISNFPDSATVSEIVGIHNFVLLCPNHHWELDYGNLAEL